MSSHTCRLPLAFQEAEWVAVIVRAVSARYTRPIRVSLSARPGVSCTLLSLALMHLSLRTELCHVTAHR
jgi:hypothetical protein